MARQPSPVPMDPLRRGRRRGQVASTTLHVIGIALSAVSVGMAACALLEALTTGRDTAALGVSALVTGAAGGLLWYLTRPGAIRKRHIFSTVAWTWVFTTVIGALPFVLGGTFATGGADFVEQVVNSLFESASGFSASGSTVLADFEAPGRGLMMYRQLTHWYGGMGVVVLAVAVLTAAPYQPRTRPTPAISGGIDIRPPSMSGTSARRPGQSRFSRRPKAPISPTAGPTVLTALTAPQTLPASETPEMPSSRAPTPTSAT